MDKHKLSYALAPIAAVMPEVMPSLEQIKSLQVHRLPVWIWPVHSFSHHRKGRSASALLHFVEDSRHLQSCSRVVFTLPPSIKIQSKEIWATWTSCRISHWSTILKAVHYLHLRSKKWQVCWRHW